MECLAPITIRVPPGKLQSGGLQKVPCGKCGFCLTNKRSSWMFRIYHEMRLQEYPGYFLTLTYDEKHVKRVRYQDPTSGDMVTRLSLRFRDVQLYLKKIRKAKFYAKYIVVGEYGSDTCRPHYHALLWTDCPPVKLEKIWAMGRIHFGRLTMASAMYTLKYIMQPRQRDHTKHGGVEKTRAQFSKGLGIGYLTTAVYNYHTCDYDNPVLFSRVDGKQVALPRYYKNKIFTRHQLRKEAERFKWENIRKKRRHMRALIKQGIVNTKVYLKGLRTEQSRRIISNCKYNLTI